MTMKSTLSHDGAIAELEARAKTLTGRDTVRSTIEAYLELAGMAAVPDGQFSDPAIDASPAAAPDLYAALEHIKAHVSADLPSPKDPHKRITVWAYATWALATYDDARAAVALKEAVQPTGWQLSREEEDAALAAVHKTPEPASWPAGCHDPVSCSRHSACMYVGTGCPLYGRNAAKVSQEIRAGVAKAQNDGPQNVSIDHVADRIGLNTNDWREMSPADIAADLHSIAGRVEEVFAKPPLAGPELSEAIEWTAELEAARVDLCEHWTKVSLGSDAAPLYHKRVLETMHVLTILGEIARRKAVPDGQIHDSAVDETTGSPEMSLWTQDASGSMLYGWTATGKLVISDPSAAAQALADEVNKIVGGRYPYPDPIALKFAQGHGWAQPGDRPHREFMLMFDDPDCKNKYFSGTHAEEVALDHWRRYAPSWSCTLFAAVRTVKP